MLIYLATNLVNDKVYIGKSLAPLRRRWSVHLAHANGESRLSRSYFHRALRKYGAAAFDIQEFPCKEGTEHLINMEKVWIILLQSNDKRFGYNLTTGGEGVPGFHHSEETRSKISNSNRGNQNTLGRKKSEDEIKRQRESANKFWASEPARKRQSEITKQKMDNPEVRRKMSIALKGKAISIERRQQLSQIFKGRKLSEETRRKMSLALIGNKRAAKHQT